MRNCYWIVIFSFMVLSGSYAQTELLTDFSIQLVTDDVNKPNGIIFDEDSRMLVWERVGLVWIFEDGVKREEPLLDIREEVMSNGDLGLLSIALGSKGDLYLYYIVDYHHLIHFGTAIYSPFKNEINKATIGRVTKYRIVDEKVDIGSRQILIGKTIDTGIPVMHTSHVGGTLLFGDDGTLLVSIGDCSTWEGNYVGDGPPYYNAKVEQALTDGIIRPEEEVGTMRAQMRNSYSGKVIRMNPETGFGLPSNPFYNEDQPDAPESKIWALGFRNPYRMTIRRGSGSSNPADGLPGNLFVGEVGGAAWEELNVITKKGVNYGWPLFEGNGKSDLHKLVQTNKDVLDCNGDPIRFQDLVKQPSLNEVVFKNPCDSSQMLHHEMTYIQQPPALNLAHITVGLGVFTHIFNDQGEIENIRIEDSRSAIIGDVGMIRSNAAIAGTIYTGDKFPEDFKNDLFITDYSNGWISRIKLDLNEEVHGIYKFYKDTFKIVHLTENKDDGCLYFVKNNGRIEKICYNVNVPPIVNVKLDQQYGPSPLAIEFDGTGTYDPEGAEMTFMWDFGDGTSSEEVSPKHTFTSGEIKTFAGKLKVTDAEGAFSEQEFIVSANNTPPDVKIRGAVTNEKYSVAGFNLYDLESDLEDGQTPSSDLELKWSLFLHHNTHFHQEQEWSEDKVHFEIPPVGCKDEIFYYRIKLEAIDPQGLGGTDEILLFPDCDDIFAELLEFKARSVKEGVELSWTFQQEDNLTLVEIQRVNSNGEFEAIGEVKSGTAYLFTDWNPEMGHNLYRLKLFSQKENVAYSEVRDVVYAGDDEVYIFPNPAHQKFNIHFDNLQGEATIRILNVEGVQVETMVVSGVGPTTKLLEPSTDLPHGTYVLLIDFNDSDVTKKLIINK